MLKNKKLLSGLTIAISLLLSACGGGEEAPQDTEGETPDTEATEETTEEATDEQVTLNIAALESGYGDQLWVDIKEAYETANENVTIELTQASNLEEVIRPNMQAGNYPDAVLLAVGRDEGLTETLIRENELENITDILDMEVYGEKITVNEKLLDGFTDTLVTNPYGDDETYLLPMFYSPTGLFYNSTLLEEHDWAVPNTWDEMFELGETAEAEGISLFTYPTAGYFDTFIGSMLYASGGTDFFNSAMSYEEDIWETEEAEEVFTTVEKLGTYTHPNTVANANPNDFTQNQQLVLDGNAIFMPNGTWVVGEMEEAPRTDGFEWDMMSVPAFEEDGDRYAFTFFEQIWVPAQAENKDAAKEFISYLYSDEAAEIFAESGAIQPIEESANLLEGADQEFYAIYDEEGALPAMGGFAATDPVPGVNISESLYLSVDSVIDGELSAEEWQARVIEASDQLREALPE